LVLVLYFNGGCVVGVCFGINKPLFNKLWILANPWQTQVSVLCAPSKFGFWRVRQLDASVCIVVHQFGTSSHGRTLCSPPPPIQLHRAWHFVLCIVFARNCAIHVLILCSDEKKEYNVSFKSSVVWKNCIKLFIYFSYFSIFVKPCCNIAQLQDSHKVRLRLCVGLGLGNWC